MVEKFGKILIPLSIVVAGLLITGTLVYFNQAKLKSPEGKVEILSPQQAAEKAINYINQNILQQGATASLINVAEENGVYMFKLKIGENEFTSYVTKDGRLLFAESPIDLESQPAATQGTEGGAAAEAPKKDTPDVKLFVMSYCPYGLQAQKMFLPVYDLLKGKAEMGVYFVNYIMHGKQEIDENLNQYCIQKEEKDKYYDYLSCFVKDGNSQNCFSQAKINREKLASCISETDAKYNVTSQYNDKSTWLNGNYPKFDVNTDLNQKYGVQGSPTIVINDTVVNVSPRTPESFKNAVCQAFSNPPAECSQTLSNESPTAGLGEGTGGNSGGSCE